MKLQIPLMLGLLATGAAAIAQERPNSAQYHAVHNPNSPNYVGPNQQPAAPQPTGYWEKTWGAIAGHSSQPILGAALGASSKDEAGQLAISDCKAKGGGGGCRLDITFYNQCAVLVTGNRVYNTVSAESIERASQLGMKRCAEKDSNCRVYYSACTEPTFHKY